MPIAKSLLDSGFQLVAFDLRELPLRDLKQLGAAIGSSPADVGGNSDFTITILPNAASVRSTVMDVLKGAKKGHTIIEMSTIDVQTTLSLEEEARKKGANFLDAPITGTPDRVATKDIIVLASGNEETVRNSMSVLLAIAKDVEYVGKAGNGKIVKLTNNLLIAAHKIATVEAISFAVKQGIEPQHLFKVVKGSTSDSKVFDRFCESAINSNSEIAKRHSWHVKDLELIIDLGRKSGAPLFLGNLSKELMQSAKEAAGGNENFESLVRYYQSKMGIEQK